jgi:hypothetical protein
MNIEGVAANTHSMSVSGASPISGGRFEGQLQGALGDVSAMLGMTPQQLNASLAPSGSLSAVAANAGVSDQQLIDTVKQGLLDSGSKLTGARLDNIATRIAHHRGLHMHSAASASSDNAAPSLMTTSWQATGGTQTA